MMGLLRISGRHAVGLALRASPLGIAWAGLVVLLAATLTVWLAPPGDKPVVASLTTEAAETPGPSAEPTPSPAGENEPTPTPSPTSPPDPAPDPEPTPTASATSASTEMPPPDPSPTPSVHGDPPCAFDGSGCDDDGSEVAFAGCRNATSEHVPTDVPTAVIAYGVEASFSTASDQVERGQTLRSELSLENTGDRTVTLDLSLGDSPRQAFLVGDPGGSSMHWTDAIEVEHLELSPGERWSLPLTVRATSCAPAEGKPEPPLAPGRYAGGGHWYVFGAEVENASPVEEKHSGPFAVGTPIDVV